MVCSRVVLRYIAPMRWEQGIVNKILYYHCYYCFVRIVIQYDYLVLFPGGGDHSQTEWYPCLSEHLKIGPYTGWTRNNGTVDTDNFQDFALINSYLCSPYWVEHRFSIILTPRSSNLVDNFLFYE